MIIPDWLKNNIAEKCECGGFIFNSDTLTFRACMNPQCPKHMAEKIVEVLKYLGVKGVGPAGAKDYIDIYKLKHHLEIIPVIFKDKKPRLYLHEIAHLAMVYGHDKDMKPYCDGCRSFDEVFKRTDLPRWFQFLENTLKNAEKFFEVKKPLSKKVFHIMMTGEVLGYPSRGMFVQHLNDAYGQYVQVVDVGFRKTGVDVLVKEQNAGYHRKTQVAEERGIPIVTPRSLEVAIMAYVKECEGDGAMDTGQEV